jgi:hypothetical protein
MGVRENLRPENLPTTKRRRAQRRLESLLPQSLHPTFYFRIHVCEGLRNRTLLGLRTRSLLLFRPKRGDPVANSHDPTTTTPLCPALPSQHKETFPLPPRSQLPFSEYEQHFFFWSALVYLNYAEGSCRLKCLPDPSRRSTVPCRSTLNSDVPQIILSHLAAQILSRRRTCISLNAIRKTDGQGSEARRWLWRGNRNKSHWANYQDV